MYNEYNYHSFPIGHLNRSKSVSTKFKEASSPIVVRWRTNFTQIFLVQLLLINFKTKFQVYLRQIVRNKQLPSYHVKCYPTLRLWLVSGKSPQWIHPVQILPWWIPPQNSHSMNFPLVNSFKFVNCTSIRS